MLIDVNAYDMYFYLQKHDMCESEGIHGCATTHFGDEVFPHRGET